MSPQQRKIISPLVIATLVLTAAVVFVARSAIKGNRVATPQIFQPPFLSAQQRAATSEGTAHRNLALQPLAFRMAKRLGVRFSAGSREQAQATGTLTIGGEMRTISVMRQQTNDGEHVEIGFAGTGGTFTWDAKGGAKSSGAQPTESERDLIEKLVMDSPDQFVLAQLRGASYYTVGQNIRSDKVSADYAGPTWTIVRVDDPESDELKRARSRWRLYYVNTRTGLIDRIVSEVNGQKTVAEVSWSDVQGEIVPTRMTWTRDGQAVMGYQLLVFSHADQKGVR